LFVDRSNCAVIVSYVDVALAACLFAASECCTTNTDGFASCWRGC